jgi:hypothetical protein
MVTVTCLFKFPDALTAEARLAVEAPEQDAPVMYSGHAEKLPDKFTELDAATLRVWAKRVARQTGARLQIRQAGRYTWWAQ